MAGVPKILFQQPRASAGTRLLPWALAGIAAYYSVSSDSNNTQASAEAAAPLRTPYPPIEPYKTGRLKVSDLHELYYEESGNPKGKPVIVLHGGPGGGTSPSMRQYFDPKRYRIILVDQRGCGKSTPHAVLEGNTTWALVEDIEHLRNHLGIDRWQVFGGSWGSTLALAYSETHPERVTEIVLRGVFLLRKQDVGFFYQEGAGYLYPDLWDEYLKPIPEEERGDMVAAYNRRLTSPIASVREEAAKAWTKWEMSTATLLSDPVRIQKAMDDNKFAIAFARIENHYFLNGGFFPTDNYLLENAYKLRHIPCTVVHGRYDIVCPIKQAWDLKKAYPELDLHIVPDSGHSMTEVGITHELLQATDKYASR